MDDEKTAKRRKSGERRETSWKRRDILRGKKMVKYMKKEITDLLHTHTSSPT